MIRCESLSIVALLVTCIFAGSNTAFALSPDTENWVSYDPTEFGAIEFVDISPAEVADLARNHGVIELNLLGIDIRFSLNEISIWGSELIVRDSHGNRNDDVEQQFAEIRVYTGIEANGATDIVVVISKASIYMTLKIEEISYEIAPISNPIANGMHGLFKSVGEPGTDFTSLDASDHSSADIDFEDSILEPPIESDYVVPVGSSAISYGTEYRLCRIIIAADYELRSISSDWPEYLYAAIGTIIPLYESQVGITFELQEVLMPDQDDLIYDTDVYALRQSFKEYMASVESPERDLSYLFTGRDLTKNGDAGNIGAAFYPGVGRDKYDGSDLAYAVSELHPYEVSMYFNACVMGHEIGHSFNADHAYADSEGLYFYTWMWEDWGPENYMEFTEANANRISTWAEETLDFRLIRNNDEASAEFLCVYDFSLKSQTSWYALFAPLSLSFKMCNYASYTVYLQSLFIAYEDPLGSIGTIGLIPNAYVSPGDHYIFEREWSPTMGGYYEFWPVWIADNGIRIDLDSYKIGMTIYQQMACRESADKFSFITYDICLFYRFGLYSTSSLNYIGETMQVHASIFNAEPIGEDLVEYEEIYIEYVSPSGRVRTLGRIQDVSLSRAVDSTVAVGGGVTIEDETIPFDETGFWHFYPQFVWEQYTCPSSGWCELVIEISEPSAPPVGCVAEGTMILMADGTEKAIEEIAVGDVILGYDPYIDLYLNECILETSSIRVKEVLSINGGELRVTLTDQPIYVLMENGTTMWVRDPSELQVGWSLLNVKLGEWVLIDSLEVENDRTRVYDFLTDGFQTYIGNSYLLMDKGKK